MLGTIKPEVINVTDNGVGRGAVMVIDLDNAGPGATCDRAVMLNFGAYGLLTSMVVGRCWAWLLVTPPPGWAHNRPRLSRHQAELAEDPRLAIPRDHQDNDHRNRGSRRYQDHRKDVLEDPVLACLPLSFLQRHSGPGRMIARGRIVQHKRLGPAAPERPPRPTDPNHHASRCLVPPAYRCPGRRRYR